MNKTISVVISPLGVANIEANGFSGTACTAATKPIEDALSGNGGTTTMKSEAYETSTESDQLQQGW